MIEKKSVLSSIKRGFQSGAVQLVGQDLTQIPKELLNLESLDISDQSWWECNLITKLDFSNNQITQIPEDISKLVGVQSVRFKSNLLKHLPVGLFSESLKFLDVSKNRIESIPKQIQGAIHLVELHLSSNNLSECPNVSPISTLEALYLDNNRMGSLVPLPKNLKRFDCSANNLRIIRKVYFEQCQSVQNIMLNKNNIQQIEVGAFRGCRKLVGLEMKENRLQKIDWIPASDSLDSISLNYNRIKQFSQFSNCPNLSVLVLADNKLQSLSGEILSLRKLKTLDLSNNDLSDLPCELGMLPQLVRIQVQGNPLKCIRQNIRSAGTEVLKKYLKDRIDPKHFQELEKKTTDPKLKFSASTSDPWEKLIMEFTQGNQLDLKGRNLQELDKRVFKEELRTLNVSNNKISAIGEGISNMNQLKILLANDNCLEVLPMALMQIDSLEQLELNRNRLASFYPEAGGTQLKRLFLLDLSVNRLVEVPPVIALFPRLRILTLSYNKIAQIEILFQEGVLEGLQIIDVSNNQIGQLSDRVANRYSSLNFLNLENNSLTKLPTVLGFMKLTALKVQGNPLKLIKRTTIIKGTTALLQDLKNKHLGPVPVFQKSLPSKDQQEHHPLNRQQEEIGVWTPKQQPCQKTPAVVQAKQKLLPNNSGRYEQQIQAIISANNTKIGQIQQQLQSNFSLNKIQKVDRKRQIQQLLVERNQLMQEMKR